MADRFYKVTGIILKSRPCGEADRLAFVLTRERGLLRAIAPRARNHKSSLCGRCEAFTVSELLLMRRNSLDRISQVETIRTYAAISSDLGKLAAAQYWAEILLNSIGDEPGQEGLYDLFLEHLRRLEALPAGNATVWLAHLCQGAYHFLAVGGIAPQVNHCCITQQAIAADFDPAVWKVGFSLQGGGVVAKLLAPPAAEPAVIYPRVRACLTPEQLARLQQLPASQLPVPIDGIAAWKTIEQLLRAYSQRQLGRAIRSAALVDTVLSTTEAPSHTGLTGQQLPPPV